MTKSCSNIFAVAGEPRLQVTAQDVESGSKTAQNRGQKSYAQGQQKHGAIHANYGFLGERSGRDESHDNLQAEISQGTASDEGGCSKQEAFGEQPLDDAGDRRSLRR